MSEFDNTPITPPSSGKPGLAGWFSVWMKAITQPNEQTFVDITEHPDMSAKRHISGFSLLGRSRGLFKHLHRLSAQQPAQMYFPKYQVWNNIYHKHLAEVDLLSARLSADFVQLRSQACCPLYFLLFFVAIIQWIAKLFGGTGTYDKLLYAFAAITVPFTIISSVFVLFSAIPFVGICTGIISIGLSIYALVLQVMAVKAVNRFGWGEAAGSVFIPGCVVFIICACVVGGSVALLMPMIRSGF